MSCDICDDSSTISTTVHVCPECHGPALSAYRSIWLERQRQNKKWGEQNHSDEWWLAILTEEVGELAQAILHAKFGGKASDDVEKELIQTAAVAAQWVECLRRNKA